MNYPNFIKLNKTIGICAPSAGVGDKLDEFNESIQILKNEGYKIKETKSVRNNNQRSASAKIRAKELDELICDKKVDMVITAAGGDYMYETLPYINYEHIKNNPKWLMGYSDPTNLLFTVTTSLDIATLYGFNASSYYLKNNSRAQKTNLNYLKGKITKQNSYKKYVDFIEQCNGKTEYDRDVKWVSNAKALTIDGRCIGGCFDVIDKIIGTKYDKLNDFIERYKDDGIVYYFDVFSMSALNFYLSLLQMKNAGYFKYCKGVLIGRVAIPTIENKDLDYIKAADKALKGIPHICDMDIGHSKPHMTMINGALIHVDYKDNKGSISFKLK